MLVRYTCKIENPADLDLVIPAGVTEIAEGVFYGRAYIRSVDLGGVTTLGAQAFDSCVGLVGVTANAVQTVGDYAFFGCELLTEITLPAVRTVGVKAFADCYALMRARLGPNLTAIGAQAFEYVGYTDVETGTLGVFYLTLEGAAAPSMGAKVFGFTPARILVQDVDTALAYLAAATWPNYAAHLLTAAGAEAGHYYCTRDQSIDLILNGRAELDGIYLLLYRITGETVQFYYYEKETDKLRTFGGRYDARTGFVSLTIGDQTLEFYPEGRSLIYSNAAEGELTVLNGQNKVIFGGREYEAAAGSGTLSFSDGQTDYTVRLYADMSYTVQKTPTKIVRTYRALDGARATITRGTSVFATLENITVDGVLIVRQSELYGTVTATGYDFTVHYLAARYKVSIVVDDDAGTFRYTWVKL